MTSTRFTSTSPTCAPMGGAWLMPERVKLTHRTLDASYGV